MNRERSSVNLVLLFILSPAFVDCFAIPLLVIASRQQHQVDQAPTVIREQRESSSRELTVPHCIDLASDSLQFNGTAATWESLIDQIKAAPSGNQILVYIRTSDEGLGPVNDLLRLSVMATEHGFADRLYIVSHEPTAKE